MLERAAEEHFARVGFGERGIEARLHEEDAVAEAVAVGDGGDRAVELEAVEPEPAARERRLHGLAVELDVLGAREGAAAAGIAPAIAVELDEAVDGGIEAGGIVPDEKA